MLDLCRSMRSRAPFSLSLLAFAGLIGLSSAASAATVSAPLTSVFGPNVTGTLTIDDAASPGNLVITATIDAADADVRSVLGEVADESLLGGLSIIGAKSRNVRFEADAVGLINRGRSPNNHGSACPCDFGIRFSGKDPGTSISFTLTSNSGPLSLALFYGQDFAVQVTGVQQYGIEGKSREGHNEIGHGRRGWGIRYSLLEGRIPNPVPEPTTALLVGLGLAGLAVGGRRA